MDQTARKPAKLGEDLPVFWQSSLVDWWRDAAGEDLGISSKPNALVLHNPVLGEGFGSDFFTLHPEFSPILHI